ncbi:MAG: HesA/MoeB/ThiF family protein, partial [Microbacteriaceae bacterium]|nr:HesA/MoeB/ThiF family protein [Microbacteriaceae bacterium]
MTAHPLDDAARERQARHARLLGYGAPGVERTARARIVVVGAGGLGAPALRVLAGADLERLTVIDDDRVDRTNLARQTLYTELDVGRGKAEAAVAALRHFAPRTELRAVAMRLGAGNARGLLRGADAVLDTTDDWPTRFAVADACRELGIPLVWGSVLAWDGLLTTFAPGGPGLDDLVDRSTQLAAPPRDCAAAGVFAPLCAEIAAAMAGEGLRLAAGLAPLLVGRVRSWDAARGTVRELPLVARDETRESSGERAADAGGEPAGAPARTDASVAPDDFEGLVPGGASPAPGGGSSESGSGSPEPGSGSPVPSGRSSPPDSASSVPGGVPPVPGGGSSMDEPPVTGPIPTGQAGSRRRRLSDA